MPETKIPEARELAAQPAEGQGGRLFDHWASELKSDFVADNPKTPEPDGKGGPFGNGTLPGSDGKPMLNPGHDYRLKNLFGWDLRGGDGIDGASYRQKETVLLPDLMSNTDSRDTWIARLEHGEDAIPRYGAVLTRAQIEAVADFLLAVRDGTLPRASDVYTLSKDAPEHYVLNSGGDAARGRDLYAAKCAGCHGADGTAFPLDHGAHSLGTFMRHEGYEAWLKILNGQPGTGMHAQLLHGSGREQLVKDLRDLAAALCDRAAYPKGAAASDVADGDLRCGEYLR